jgi:hypothetical protein
MLSVKIYGHKTGGALPELNEGPVSECSRPGKTVCSAKRDIDIMQKFLAASGARQVPATPDAVVKSVATMLGVAKESDIYESPSFQRFTGPELARQKLFENFLGNGPADSTALLSDTNIDGALARWAVIGTDEFNKKFHHVPFQMIDFLQHQTDLARLDVADLHQKGYDCFGVVLNTDVSSGRGIHWFCIYCSLGKTKQDKTTLEYFNSSGFPPKSEVTYWLEQTAAKLRQAGFTDVEIVHATGGKQVQNSKTECGVWSLVYILSRLMNKPPNWIVSVGANDDDMVSFRKRLFRL